MAEIFSVRGGVSTRTLAYRTRTANAVLNTSNAIKSRAGVLMMRARTQEEAFRILRAGERMLDRLRK